MSFAIRITFVIPTLDQSGAERQLTLLAIGLKRLEFDVRVIALSRGGYFADQLLSHGISVEILQKRFRFDPLTFVRLRRILRSTEPSIVQSFLFSANSYVRLPRVCPAGTRIIVSERCVDSWKSGWQLKIDRWLNDRMDAMTANSASVAEFYRKTARVTEEKIVIIPNGIPAFNDVHENNLRDELGLSSDARLIGFAGRFAPQKCLADLTWGFQLMRQAMDNVHLILVGEGPERDELAQLAANFDCRHLIHFLGHRHDARSIISQLDVFCLPSSFEGMSNSLMEAMSSGVPVVVSDIAANLELVEHDKSGMVFPLGDGLAIAKALKQILEDPEFARRIGSAARNQMNANHSVDAMINAHVDLYSRLCPSN